MSLDEQIYRTELKLHNLKLQKASGYKNKLTQLDKDLQKFDKSYKTTLKYQLKLGDDFWQVGNINNIDLPEKIKQYYNDIEALGTNFANMPDLSSRIEELTRYKVKHNNQLTKVSK